MTSTDQWDIVSSVGLTALGVAAARAIDSAREDALVHDPLAERFVELAQPPTPLPTRPEHLGTGTEAGKWGWTADFMGIRSRYFDELFAEATADGVRQVVVLAAGLDVRAQRLDWPADCHVFEVDQPRVLEFKDEVLAETGAQQGCQRHLVRADLREDWSRALLAAGFDPSRPTAWLAEGLLTYLPAQAQEQLFDTVRRLSAPGSRIGVEYVRDMPTLLAHPKFRGSTDQFGVDLGELWNREPRRAAEDQLRDLGWTVEVEHGREVATRYGRALDPDAGAMIGEHGILLSGRLP